MSVITLETERDIVDQGDAGKRKASIFVTCPNRQPSSQKAFALASSWSRVSCSCVFGVIALFTLRNRFAVVCHRWQDLALPLDVWDACRPR